jgi:hypothetical protein
MSGGTVHIRGGKKAPLYHGTDPVHDTRTDMTAAGELIGHHLQKSIALVARQRPGRGHHGLKFDVAQGDRRHG